MAFPAPCPGRRPPGAAESAGSGLDAVMSPTELLSLACLRRVHFCTHKSEPKKRQPPSGWTPAFAQSDASKGDTRLPLKYRWILVIGAASYVLRLSALVMRGISVFLSKIYLLPQNPGSSSRKTRWRYPFNRATAEAGRETRRRSDPRRTRWFCGNRVSNFIGTDWTKGGGPGSPRRFFPPFLGGQKWGRRRHAGV